MKQLAAYGRTTVIVDGDRYEIHLTSLGHVSPTKRESWGLSLDDVELLIKATEVVDR